MPLIKCKHLKQHGEQHSSEFIVISFTEAETVHCLVKYANLAELSHHCPTLSPGFASQVYMLTHTRREVQYRR